MSDPWDVEQYAPCGGCGHQERNCTCHLPKCPDCEGRGWVEVYEGEVGARLRETKWKPETCMACLGTGRI